MVLYSSTTILPVTWKYQKLDLEKKTKHVSRKQRFVFIKYHKTSFNFRDIYSKLILITNINYSPQINANVLPLLLCEK